MKIKDFKCKCGHNDFFFADKGSQKGIYCSYCGKWLKWADKDEQNLAMKQESKSEWQKDHEILKAYSDGANEVLDKIRAEIWDLQYGEEEKSMTDENRADAYNNAIKQVIEIIDKYKGESEKQTDGNHENKKS